MALELQNRRLDPNTIMKGGKTLAEVEAEFNAAWKSRQVNVTNLGGPQSPPKTDRYEKSPEAELTPADGEGYIYDLRKRGLAAWRVAEGVIADDYERERISLSNGGKKVVDNRNDLSAAPKAGKDVYCSAAWAANLAKHDVPVHAFFFEDTGFLTEAAKKYATLSDDEVFWKRDILDGEFVENTLDFLTNGNYTWKDKWNLQQQMTAVVEEMARQIKNGETPDINRIQSKITIGGADTTIGELLNYQKMGKEMILNCFRGDENPTGWQSVGMQAPLWGKLAADHAKAGLAKSVVEYYGNQRGEIGKLFSGGFNRLYEKAMARKEDSASMDFWGDSFWSREAVNIYVDAARNFGKLDTSGKESMTRDFEKTLNQLQSRIQTYCYKNYPNMTGIYDRYNPYGVDIDLNGMKAELQDFFQSWMNRIESREA